MQQKTNAQEEGERITIGIDRRGMIHYSYCLQIHNSVKQIGKHKEEYSGSEAGSLYKIFLEDLDRKLLKIEIKFKRTLHINTHKLTHHDMQDYSADCICHLTHTRELFYKLHPPFLSHVTI